MQLALHLINTPAILLLDEPTTGLDPNARREIWEILHKLKKVSETSMILTTHYMEEAENLCDYIVIMDNGVILRKVPLTISFRKPRTLDDLFVSLTGRRINE